MQTSLYFVVIYSVAVNKRLNPIVDPERVGSWGVDQERR